MKRFYSLAMYFCLSSALALLFFAAGGLKKMLVNRYLEHGLYLNALSCYRFDSWPAFLLNALLIIALGGLAAAFIRRFFRRRKVALFAFAALALAAVAFVFWWGFKVEYRAGELDWGIFELRAASILIAAILFMTQVFGPSQRSANRTTGKAAAFAIAGALFVLVPLGMFAAKQRLTTARATGGPNVLLISIDTLRADHLGCYGYPKNLSPNIDGFAADSVVFTNAIAPSPWTLPSHVGMLTGYHPSAIGVRTEKERIPASIDTLAELLREHGYATASFNGGGFVGRTFGFGQGFDTFWSDASNDSPSPEVIRTANAKTMEFLKKLGRRKFFIFYHTYQVHHPYWFHEGFSEPDAKRCEYGVFGWPKPTRECHIAYEGEIRYMDHYIGELLDFLTDRGLYDDTLIILTADHGEVFVDDGRGMIGHGYLLYDELIKVPLIVKFPHGTFGGRVVSTQVRLENIAPTVLDWLGIGNFGGQGKSLLPIIKGEETSDRAAVSEFHPFPNPKIYRQFPELNVPRLSLRNNDSKLILNMARHAGELYDLVRDPKEKNNLLESPEPDTFRTAADMFVALLLELERLHGERGPRSEAARLTPDVKEQLKALGYVQ